MRLRMFHANPRDLDVFTQAYICQGDAFLAMDEFGEAENAYSHALSVDPSIRRSKSFKVQFNLLDCFIIKLKAIHVCIFVPHAFFFILFPL